MSIRVNSLVLGGTVGKDPEVKVLSSGKKIAKFSIAQDTGREGEANWYDVTAWEKQADVIEKLVCKGSVVVITGRLDQDKWEDKEGQKRIKAVVIANNTQLVGGKRKEDGGGGTTESLKDEDIPF